MKRKARLCSWVLVKSVCSLSIPKCGISIEQFLLTSGTLEKKVCGEFIIRVNFVTLGVDFWWFRKVFQCAISLCKHWVVNQESGLNRLYKQHCTIAGYNVSMRHFCTYETLAWPSLPFSTQVRDLYFVTLKHSHDVPDFLAYFTGQFSGMGFKPDLAQFQIKVWEQKAIISLNIIKSG